MNVLEFPRGMRIDLATACVHTCYDSYRRRSLAVVASGCKRDSRYGEPNHLTNGVEVSRELLVS